MRKETCRSCRKYIKIFPKSIDNGLGLWYTDFKRKRYKLAIGQAFLLTTDKWLTTVFLRQSTFFCFRNIMLSLITERSNYEIDY